MKCLHQQKAWWNMQLSEKHLPGEGCAWCVWLTANCICVPMTNLTFLTQEVPTSRKRSKNPLRETMLSWNVNIVNTFMGFLSLFSTICEGICQISHTNIWQKPLTVLKDQDTHSPACDGATHRVRADCRGRMVSPVSMVSLGQTLC